MKANFDINEEFNQLIIKYNIFKYDREDILGFGDYRCKSCYNRIKGTCISRLKIRSLVNGLFDKFPQDSIVAIRGTGKHTEELFLLLDEKIKSRVSYLIDRSYQNYLQSNAELRSIPFLHTDDVVDKKIDYFIISSYRFRQDIKEDLINMGYKNDAIIDIYDYFDSNDVPMKKPFYKTLCLYKKDIEMTFNNYYYDINRALTNYKDAIDINNDNVSQIFLYQLILQYLNIKDFINARRYIREYIEKKYQDYYMFEKFISEIDQMFCKIKKLISNHTNDNIIVFLFDTLESNFIDQMDNLNELRKNSIVFENSFTQYHFTTPTLQTMFTGKDLIDEKAYNTDSIEYENSEVLRILQDNGYYRPCFINTATKTSMFQNVNAFTKQRSLTISEKLWNLVGYLADQKEKGFYFLHFLDTHPPYNSGNSVMYMSVDIFRYNSTENEKALHILNALKYVDGQFAFYNNLITDNNTKVIMSDHGYISDYKVMKLEKEFLLGHGTIYSDLRNVLFVNSKKYKPIYYKQMFSLKDFNKLIKFLVGICDIRELFTDYAKIQLLPHYDIGLLNNERILNHPLPKKGIITLNEKYIINYNGVEEYYINDAENKNKISDPEYADRINELRDLCGSDFYNIFEEPKFAYAKKIYTEKGLL